MLWTNYIFESRIRFIQGTVFICLRAQNPNTFYDVAISMDDWIHIAEFDRTNGYQVLAEHQEVIIKNKWYLIQVAVEENNIRLYIDNQLILTAQSNSRAYGGIGYYLGGGEIIEIDDIRVWSLN